MLRFWGKARPLDPQQGARWHPLVFHSLDVAAVGDVLLARNPNLQEHFHRLLGIPVSNVRPLIRFLLGLHDIGKFARRFQAKEPAQYPECLGGDPATMSTRYDHGAGGLRLFDACADCFVFPVGASPRIWRPLVSAVTGHHGSPPEPRIDETLTALQPDFGRRGIDAARAFSRAVRELSGMPQELCLPDRRAVRRASHALAGIAVLADWIGSAQEWFPYKEPVRGIESYWQDTVAVAARAVQEADVTPARASESVGYHHLIGTRVVASPMQEWARTVALPAGPALFLIEDETGSGKTEAAVMLAYRLLKVSRLDGLYVALPTMATANAMYDRLAAAYRHLFTADARPSIALAHGARAMHEGFRGAMSRGGRHEVPYSGPGQHQDGSDTTASAACAAWIADDRRRAFQADVGAGTIDQALLSVLPNRHQSLRLLGLMRRVLILDEVHAYDAYMQREIERLLQFQAGLGGSAILLSATLPQTVRKRLTAAFTRGLGYPANDADAAMDYPLVTVCAAGVESSTRVAGRSDRARQIPVRFLRSTSEALGEICAAAGRGRAVLYIRNTVDDVLDTHVALEAHGVVARLFHARYALIDRLEAERRVVKMFGKHSTDVDRRGEVLIATQVVEQSLDIDFDVLVTDLAPIDLLIQRAGRLWRHEHRDRSGQPELVVVGPEPVADPDEKWFARMFPRAAHVYKNHACLWLTAKVLHDAAAIDSPDGLRSLVEFVYGDDADQSVPDGLMANFLDAEGTMGAERGLATGNVLDFDKGYLRDGGAWASDTRTPTRLNDNPQVTLRLARARDGRIEPYAHSAAPIERWRAWRLSEVNVSAHRVAGEALSPEHAAAARVAKADWTRFDADKILVVLERSDAGDGVLVGAVLSGADGDKSTLRYDPIRGLRWR